MIYRSFVPAGVCRSQPVMARNFLLMMLFRVGASKMMSSCQEPASKCTQPQTRSSLPFVVELCDCFIGKVQEASLISTLIQIKDCVIQTEIYLMALA